MKHERITISFLSEDKDIIEHLKKVKLEGTISSYIRNLIRQDMLGTSQNNHSIEHLIETIINKLPHIQSNPLVIQKEPSFGIEEKCIIDNLF